MSKPTFKEKFNPIQKLEPLKEVLEKHPTWGPKPLTLEEYRRRSQKAKPVEVVQKKEKIRGGTLINICREIKDFYRLIPITKDEKTKETFIEQIKILKRRKWQFIKERNKNKKKKNNQ